MTLCFSLYITERKPRNLHDKEWGNSQDTNKMARDINSQCGTNLIKLYYYIVVGCILYYMEKDSMNTIWENNMWHRIEEAQRNRNWHCFYRTIQIWSLWIRFHNNLINISFKAILSLCVLMWCSPSNFLITHLAFKIIFHGLP